MARSTLLHRTLASLLAATLTLGSAAPSFALKQETVTQSAGLEQLKDELLKAAPFLPILAGLEENRKFTDEYLDDVMEKKIPPTGNVRWVKVGGKKYPLPGDGRSKLRGWVGSVQKSHYFRAELTENGRVLELRAPEFKGDLTPLPAKMAVSRRTVQGAVDDILLNVQISSDRIKHLYYRTADGEGHVLEGDELSNQEKVLQAAQAVAAEKDRLDLGVFHHDRWFLPPAPRTAGLEEWGPGPSFRLHWNPKERQDNRAVIHQFTLRGDQLWMTLLKHRSTAKALVGFILTNSKENRISQADVVVYRVKILEKIIRDAEAGDRLPKGTWDEISLPGEGRLAFKNPRTVQVLKSAPVLQALAEDKATLLLKEKQRKPGGEPSLLALALELNKESAIVFHTAGDDSALWSPLAEIVVIERENSNTRFLFSSLPGVVIDREKRFRSRQTPSPEAAAGLPIAAGLEGGLKQAQRNFSGEPRFFQPLPVDAKPKSAVVVNLAKDERLANLAWALAIMQVKQPGNSPLFRVVVEEKKVSTLLQKWVTLDRQALPQLTKRLIVQKSDERNDAAVRRAITELEREGLLGSTQVQEINELTLNLAETLRRFFITGGLNFLTDPDAFAPFKALLEAA